MAENEYDRLMERASRYARDSWYNSALLIFQQAREIKNTKTVNQWIKIVKKGLDPPLKDASSSEESSDEEDEARGLVNRGYFMYGNQKWKSNYNTWPQPRTSRTSMQYEREIADLKEQLDASEAKCKKLAKQKRIAWNIANNALKHTSHNPNQTQAEAQDRQKLQEELDKLYEDNAEKARKLETIENDCKQKTQTMIDDMIEKAKKVKNEKRQREIEKEQEEVERKKWKEYLGDKPTLF